MILGRSVGSGIAVHLASRLQLMGTPPGALVLHSPYTSIRDVSRDVLGGAITSLFMDRWSNWTGLCKNDADSGLSAPVMPVLPIENGNADSETETKTKTNNNNTNSIESDKEKKTSDGRNKPLYSREQLSAAYRKTKGSTSSVRSPCLLLHADQDQIIDHHHSATLHMVRLRSNLPSKLHTQKSSYRFKKDHNMFDHHNDVIVPMLHFLKDLGLVLEPDDIPAARWDKETGKYIWPSEEEKAKDPESAASSAKLYTLDLGVVTRFTEPPVGTFLSRAGVARMRQTRLSSPAQGGIYGSFSCPNHCVLLLALTYALSPTPHITSHRFLLRLATRCCPCLTRKGTQRAGRKRCGRCRRGRNTSQSQER